MVQYKPTPESDFIEAENYPTYRTPKVELNRRIPRVTDEIVDMPYKPYEWQGILKDEGNTKSALDAHMPYVLDIDNVRWTSADDAVLAQYGAVKRRKERILRALDYDYITNAILHWTLTDAPTDELTEYRRDALNAAADAIEEAAAHLGGSLGQVAADRVNKLRDLAENMRTSSGIHRFE